jgi:methylenetetrahydrofolate--tRNA-(uracil-5-)-methyltransferase
MRDIFVLGAGLAGSEAAWQLAERGLSVTLYEMRPVQTTNAHHTGDCAELVCSNSFRSDDADTNAVGLLHQEMRSINSLIFRCADAHRLPAGGALAVDRVGFAQAVTAALEAHPRITIRREEVAALPNNGDVIIATGPLTSPPLAEAIRGVTGADALAFFDAIAPIIHTDSINMDSAWRQSRYDKGDGADYINCPLDEAQYRTFISELKAAEKTVFKEWEANTPYFDGCLPIEIMAERGEETLRFGPMKPVGLTNPRAPDKKPYGIVQLRQDNTLGTLYNMVGFQTKLKYAEQTRIFRLIPGLENAEFARLGGLHRNTYIDSPRLLDATLRLKSHPHLRFAGQITGCEGYVESASVGWLAGSFLAAEKLGEPLTAPPLTTALGALLAHITGGHLSVAEEEDAAVKKPRSYQPMNINFGLFPPLTESVKSADGKRLRGTEKTLAKKRAMSDRARRDLADWLAHVPSTA